MLGTAQFGMPYGITNRNGQVGIADVRDILRLAADNEISLLDTAPVYGSSEATLGECLFEFPAMNVVTKLSAIAGETVSANDIIVLRNEVAHSLERLRLSQLYGLLLHNFSDLLKPGGDAIAGVLSQLKSEGLVSKIGVSIYTADQIDHVLSLFRPDIVQLPLNIFDQRLIASGHIQVLQSAGVEIHARSAFLQGVLLTPQDVPQYFRSFDDDFGRYSAFLEERKLTPLSANLGFMLQQSGADRVIIGVTSRAELADILGSLPDHELPPMAALASASLNLVDPRAWPTQPAASAMTAA